MSAAETLNGALDERARDAIAAALERAPAHVTRASLAAQAKAREGERAKAADARMRHDLAAVMEAADATLAAHCEDGDARAAALDRAILESAPSSLASRAVDLGALIRDGIPPVEYLPGEFARRMVYAVGVTGFTGHPESGKTSMVGRLALDAMRAGRHVVYLDWENGEPEMARRFSDLGAENGLLSERLTYVPFPGSVDWDEIGALWDAHPGAVGVFDSTRGILRTLGLDEDRASEVGRFMDPLAEFALSRKVACLLIDHVAKAATDATGYARGSGDKLAAVQGKWYVKRVRAFSETETGEIELVRWKARSGGLARVHRFAVGDGEGNLTFRRLDPDQSPEGRLDAAIIAFLRERHPETASLNDVTENVEGTATKVRERVKVLAADEARPVGTVEGDKRGVRYAYDPAADREPRGHADF